MIRARREGTRVISLRTNALIGIALVAITALRWRRRSVGEDL
jgi:hypothetical protein